MLPVNIVIGDKMLCLNSIDATALPRIRDKVCFNKTKYSVIDVLWDLDNQMVVLFLELA